MYSYYMNRTLCEVLEEMRNAVKTMNFNYLPGLIEEAQSMGNRMEAALSDIKDHKRIREEISELKKELKAQKKKLKMEDE